MQVALRTEFSLERQASGVSISLEPLIDERLVFKKAAVGSVNLSVCNQPAADSRPAELEVCSWPEAGKLQVEIGQDVEPHHRHSENRGKLRGSGPSSGSSRSTTSLRLNHLFSYSLGSHPNGYPLGFAITRTERFESPIR